MVKIAMANSTESNEEKVQVPLNIGAYRSKNQDLRNMADNELVEHFKLCGYKERRTFAYANTTLGRLSMKYLRGEGMEIGAGGDPAPLYGNASCLYADIAEDTVFDSTKNNNNKILFDINHPTSLSQRFDFVIACHVLEHVDSLIAGLSTIGQLLEKDGIAYIILPNMECDADQFWMSKFGRIHHIVEKFWPSAFRTRHERDFCRGMTDIDPATGWGPIQQKFPEELKRDILKVKVTPDFRYIYHRHSYNFRDWTSLLLFLTKITNPQLTLIDATTGDERSDCHFVFKRS